MHFDGTVTLPALMTMAATITGMIGMFYALKGRVDRIAEVLSEIRDDVKAVMVRIQEHDRDIATLKARAISQRAHTREN